MAGCMRTVVLAWVFFLLTGLLVSLILPLGEGFDEPWHFGYVQYVAQTGKLPPGPTLHLSTELEQFLALHPMGWRLHDIFPNLRTQEQYWQRPEPERLSDDDRIRSLRFSTSYSEGASEFSKQYESHQAPLYYVLTAPFFLYCARHYGFADTFLLVRLWSVLLASLVVPLSYLLAIRVSRSDTTASMVALLVAMFPGLYPDIARISNDALAVPLAAAIFLALALYLDSRSRRNAAVLGILLLLGLATKAFFIPVLLAIVLTLLVMRENRAATTVALVSAAGWVWYVRNLWITGAMTGLPETVSAKTTMASSLTSVGAIRWMDVLRLAAVSHIWMGNWSLLQYRGWIYQTVLVLYGIGIVGFLAYLWKVSSRAAHIMLFIYAVYGASLLYYATQVFQQTGIAVIQGWYLSPFVPFESLAFALGIGFLFPHRVQLWSAAFVGLCFLALLIYGNVFIAAPYYSGLTDHASSGHLRAYHPHFEDAAIMGERLVRFHPGIPRSAPLLAGIAVLLAGLSLLWSMTRERA